MRRLNSRQKHGFALLVTLALLVLASTLMVATGRAALSAVSQEKLEANDRQRRWGAISIRQAILPVAAELLTQRELEQKAAMPIARCTLVLGGLRYDLEVADEEAKANVNSLIERRGVAVASDKLALFLSGTGQMNHLHLHASEVSTTSRPSTGPPRYLSSPGQMFDRLDPKVLGGHPPREWTLWGSGAINVMRASAPAMRLAMDPGLSRLQVARLVDARDAALALSVENRLARTGNLNQSLTQIMSEAQVDQKPQSRVALVTRTDCCSLWIDVDDHRRHWYSLDVVDTSNPGEPRSMFFSW